MSKPDKKQIYIQTFDFAGKNVTLEDTEALSDEEDPDHFIEFKAQETGKIPEINIRQEDPLRSRICCHVTIAVMRTETLREDSGATSWTSSSPASRSRWGSAMSGGFPTSATRMEEVDNRYPDISRYPDPFL